MKAFHKSVYLLCLLSLIGSLLLSVGVTTARYRTAVNGDLSFQAALSAESGSLSLVSPQGWVTTAQGASVTFAVSPIGEAAGRSAYVRLTATELAGDGVTVTLTADGKTYTFTKGDKPKTFDVYTQMDGVIYAGEAMDESFEETANAAVEAGLSSFEWDGRTFTLVNGSQKTDIYEAGEAEREGA